MFNTTGGLDGMGQCQTQWVNSAEIATNLNSPRVPWRQCLPTLHTQAQETNGAAAKAQGCIPPLPIATFGSGH